MFKSQCNPLLSKLLNPTKALKGMIRLPRFNMPSTRMFGIELEFYLLNMDGVIINSADTVIDELKKKLHEIDIKKECAHSMIEITSFPHLSSAEVFGKFFSDFETILYEAERLEVGLFNYGCYPGKNQTLMRTDMLTDTRYVAYRKIFGEKEFLNAGKCIGFHCHYSLPHNSFNRNVKFFFLDIKPRKQKTVLDLFNLAVALDPALTTFLQSSPYFEGALAGKDARLLAYRGEPDISLPNSVYSKYPQFGTLNEYASDFNELVKRIRERSAKLSTLLAEHGYSLKDFAKEEVSLLDSSWKPVKINAHGTVESRGMDMNTLPVIASGTVVIKNLSRYVEKNNIHVQPSETGDSEPFALEDDTLHVPQRERILELQKNSAFVGMENPMVHDYTRRLLRLTKTIFSKEQYQSLHPFVMMIDERKTTSDKILEQARKIQGKNIEVLDQETAQKIAVKCADHLYKDVLTTKKTFEGFTTSSVY